MTRLTLALLIALTAAACGADESTAAADEPTVDAGAEAPAPDGGAEEDPPPAVPTVAETLDCEAEAWDPPGLNGPAFTGGMPTQALEGELVVSSTVLFVNPTPEGQQRFGELLGPIFLALVESEGLLGQATTFDERCSVARTFTVWRDEASMYQFVGSRAHVDAMIAWAEFSRPESAVTHWTQPAGTLPSWADAVARANQADGVGAAP